MANRRSVWLAGAALAALAFGASAAPPAAVLDVEQACPQGMTGGRVERGIGYGESEPSAVQAAEADATARLLNRVCTSAEDERCAYYRRFFKLETTRWAPGGGGKACAVVSVRNEVLDSYDLKTRELKAQIGRAAAAVVTWAAGRGVTLDEVTWRGPGCRAPEGDYIVEVLKADLAAQGVSTVAVDGLHLVPQLSWATGSDARFTLVDAYDQPVPSGNFEFDAGVLNLTNRSPCQQEALTSVEPGQRRGSDGLLVTLGFNGSSTLCEGDTITPIVRTNRAAFVHLYAVSDEGLAYHVWPTDGASGYVKERLVIPEPLLAWRTRSSERIVAVASVEPGGFGQTNGWDGFCRSLAFDDDLFPPGVAMASATYFVGGPGTPSCSRQPALAESLLGALVDAPLCGAR